MITNKTIYSSIVNLTSKFDENDEEQAKGRPTVSTTRELRMQLTIVNSFDG
jgi:hypothetical protein